MERRFYTVNEAAAILRVHRTTLVHYIKTGRIYAIQLQAEYRIPCEVIDDFGKTPKVTASKEEATT